MWLFKKRDNANDEQLASDYFNSGDKKFVGYLFERHVKTVYGACLFYFKDVDSAQDAVMQIFEKLIVDLLKTEIKNFKGWLGFVVRNYCLSELRKNKGKYFVSESYLDFELKDGNADEEDKIATVHDDLMLEYLKEVLQELKDTQKICVKLFYLENLSYEEISLKTKFSVNEVKSYIQNGKRNLKLLVEQKIKNTKNAIRR